MTNLRPILSSLTLLAWGRYERLPRLDTYRKLKQHAKPAGQWDERRPRALKLLRAHLKRESAKQAASPYRVWHRADRSGLVRIFLWEGDIDAAWTEAKDCGCSPELWLELAERRRAHHPEDALDVYQAQVEPTIERKNNDAYQQAVGRVREIQMLCAAVGRPGEFPIYLTDLRTRHKRKRNLVKLLDAL